MSIQIAIRHHTEYLFDRKTQIYPHLLRLRPAPHCRTPILSYSLDVEPEHFINWQQDAFGNYLARFVFPEKARSLTFEVNLVADMTTINPFDFFLEESAQKIPFSYSKQQLQELAPYLHKIKAGKHLKEWLDQVSDSPKATIDFLVEINQRLQRDIGYVIRMEPGVQTPEETLKKSLGSCRDSAWLLVQIFRHLGYAARFVSGYLIQLVADVKSLDGPSGTEKDFTDLHAWTEVYVPGAGWIGLDPTSGLFAGEGHIPLACSPDPSSAAPITGSTGKCEVEFKFANEVHRFREAPRTTKPYHEHQWQAIHKLGEQVDRQIEEHDIRLTMGGEPTFISLDDMDGDEWNFTALSPRKRALAEDLFQRLCKQFSPGAVRHYAQGKWYPGEPLPRWALNSYWRRDEVPVWEDSSLLANPTKQGKADTRNAAIFLQTLAAQLGVNPKHMQPGYEDALYYLWQEGSLPENLNPEDNRLQNKLDRARLRDVFSKGLGEVVGYYLPLAHPDEKWISSAWTFKRKHMFLIPSDSPMGLRLPLSSLLHVKERFLPQPEDPFAHEGQLRLPDTQREAVDFHRPEDQQLARRLGIEGQFADDSQDDLHIGTALCTQIRNGWVHVFVPPVAEVEHYFDLIRHIETVAAQLNEPVVIEGYDPPSDHRLRKLSVTPDPGVIEVNIHPSASWPDMVKTTEVLYNEAREARLATEKFNLDGRHTGTRARYHVTLVDSSPADSPLLRRPQLLASLIRYWQNHPSLSYLFSGQFIGPTSQSPRVDEARDETLYELEIALQQIPDGDSPQPWLIDRILRNLLIDVTGNTHRAEFCIDKLYNPNSPTGRLGLLEFRGFEMPPHPQMSLVQQLLLRTLVTHFWQAPYRQPLIRWGGQLHDRWMLPHFVAADIRAVADDLQRWGYEFDGSWFDPFLEFRFPRYGKIQLKDIELELRFAIEPWHVLGEEMSSQGTSRYVDSSVEKLQVKVSGIEPERHVVLCNGRCVPLHNTGQSGEFIGAVRFKAWDPPSALHPNIGKQAPLIFDVVDTWSELSLGGCTYHVAHPGGRNYDSLPINSFEAEARRHARFWQTGHTGGIVQVPQDQTHPTHPYTLDLRYQYSK